MTLWNYVKIILENHNISNYQFIKGTNNEYTVIFDTNDMNGEGVLQSLERIMIGKWYGEIYMTDIDLYVVYRFIMKRRA